MVGLGDFEALPARDAEVRSEPAGRAFGPARNVEDGKERQVDPEQLQMAADEPDPLGCRIVDDLGRGDRPARALGAAGRRRHRTGRINGILERRDVTGSHRSRGSEPRAALKHDHQIVDRPVAKRVGQLDGLADDLVALRGEKDDIPLGMDLARLAVPDDTVGGEVIAFAVHPHLAGRRHYVGIAVVRDLVRAELDGLLGCRGRRRRRLGRGLRRQSGRGRHQHRER